MYKYNEEEIERFGSEGGAFLLRHGIVNIDEDIQKYGIIDTPDIREIKRFRRKIEGEEEIEKIDYEESLRKPFSIIKLNERSDKKMDYEFGDSADNEDLELEDLMEKFDEEEIDDDILKEIKVIPQKLKDALKSCYKILNEYKEDIKDLSPELFSAVSTLGKLAGISGKKPYPYPYPGGKLKKSSKAIPWENMMEQMFSDVEEEDEDFEKADEKPTRETPWPSFDKEVKKQARKIEKIVDELEEDSFDPYDRMA